MNLFELMIIIYKIGIKGECIFNNFKYYHPMLSTNIDVMHSIFLGIVKDLFYYWFEHPTASRYSLKNHLVELNERIFRCRPPQYVTQAPRKLDDFNNWRAHEFMNFILYFAIPVFSKVMNPEYFKHLLYLIIPIEKLLEKNIKKDKFKLIHDSLCVFVKKLEELYDVHILKSGAHELLHLTLCTEQLGPINQNNCFPFEELNRKVNRYRKSNDLIGDEFLKLLNASKNFSLYIDELEENNGERFYKFIKNHFQFKSSNIKNKKSDEVSRIKLGKKIIIELSDYMRNFLSSKLKTSVKLTFYESLYLNNIMYSIEKNTKFSNSTISYQNKYGLISYILKNDDSIYMCCKSIVLASSPYFTETNNSKLKSNFSNCSISNNFFLIEDQYFSLLQKHFMFKFNDECLLTEFVGNHLFS